MGAFDYTGTCKEKEMIEVLDLSPRTLRTVADALLLDEATADQLPAPPACLASGGCWCSLRRCCRWFCCRCGELEDAADRPLGNGDLRRVCGWLELGLSRCQDVPTLWRACSYILMEEPSHAPSILLESAGVRQKLEDTLYPTARALLRVPTESDDDDVIEMWGEAVRRFLVPDLLDFTAVKEQGQQRVVSRTSNRYSRLAKAHGSPTRTTPAMPCVGVLYRRLCDRTEHPPSQSSAPGICSPFPTRYPISTKEDRR